MTKRNKHCLLRFRAHSRGSLILFSRSQHVKLARSFFDWRAQGRDVFYAEAADETGIQEAKARISEMRAMGFPVLTLPQPNPRKGDRRKLLRLAAEAELIGKLEGEEDD